MWRIGHRVDHPTFQRRCAATGAPVGVKPPAHLQVGEGQQRVKGVGADRRHRANLDEAREPGGQPRPPPRDLPGGVGGERVRGLGEAEAVVLGE